MGLFGKQDKVPVVETSEKLKVEEVAPSSVPPNMGEEPVVETTIPLTGHPDIESLNTPSKPEVSTPVKRAFASSGLERSSSLSNRSFSRSGSARLLSQMKDRENSTGMKQLLSSFRRKDSKRQSFTSMSKEQGNEEETDSLELEVQTSAIVAPRQAKANFATKLEATEQSMADLKTQVLDQSKSIETKEEKLAQNPKYTELDALFKQSKKVVKTFEAELIATHQMLQELQKDFKDLSEEKTVVSSVLTKRALEVQVHNLTEEKKAAQARIAELEKLVIYQEGIIKRTKTAVASLLSQAVGSSQSVVAQLGQLLSQLSSATVGGIKKTAGPVVAYTGASTKKAVAYASDVTLASAEKLGKIKTQMWNVTEPYYNTSTERIGQYYAASSDKIGQYYAASSDKVWTVTEPYYTKVKSTAEPYYSASAQKLGACKDKAWTATRPYYRKYIHPFKEGEKVNADFYGAGLRPAVVVKVNADGTYNVMFEEGSKEVQLSEESIYKISHPPATPAEWDQAFQRSTGDLAHYKKHHFFAYFAVAVIVIAIIIIEIEGLSFSMWS